MKRRWKPRARRGCTASPERPEEGGCGKIGLKETRFLIKKPGLCISALPSRGICPILITGIG